MLTDDNMRTERRTVDALNNGNADIFDEVCSVDFVYHNPTGPDMNRDGLKQTMRMMWSAFPDSHIVLDEMLSDGDKVAMRMSVRATHLGEFWGIVATGKQVRFEAHIVDRFSDGKIVEEWEIVDFLGLLRQLGTKLP